MMRTLALAASAVLCMGAAKSKHNMPYQSTKLASGLEVITLESHKVPLVTIVLTVKAGGMTETPATNGLTHLWEHMFFKGNKSIPNQEAYNRRIRQLGITYNGDTSAEKVRYYFTMPSAFLDEGLKFMYDAIDTPLLEQTELEKERKVVMDEYDRSAAQPGFDNRRLTRGIIYGDKEYLRDPLGERPIIAKASRKQLLKMKDEVFVPKNSALLISGDFQTKDVLKLVKKHFAKWKNPKNWKPIPQPTFQKFPKSISYVMHRPNVMNAQVALTYQGPTVESAVEDTYIADVFVSLLSVRTGKFYKKFMDSGMTLGAGVMFPTQRSGGQLTLAATADAAVIENVKAKLLEETNLWTKPGYFTKTQLEDVRRALMIDHKRELNKPSEFIKTLGFWWAIAGLDYHASYLDKLRSTSLDDVTQFCKKYFQKKPFVSSILVSPEDGKKFGLKDTSGTLAKKHLSL